VSEVDGWHDELRKVARDLLSSPGAAGDGGEPATLDWALATQLGWVGLEVPTALGGSGATFAEVAVVVEELGRAACAAPYLGTVVLGVGALVAVEPGPGRDSLLAGIGAGDVRVAVGLPTGDEAAGDVRPAFGLACDGAGLRLDGEVHFVPDAPDAHRLLVVAADPDGVSVVVSLDPAGRGVAVEPTPVVDGSRSLGTVTAASAPVGDAEVWRFAGDHRAALARLVQRGALAAAVDGVGVAGAMLDATVAYAGARHQFGRPIGSFQAVKHACADMLVQLSLSRELVAVAVGDVVAGSAATGTSVAMAKSHAGAMAVEVAGAAMQLHGGIGYTWASGVPRHLKRATLDRSLFGSPRAHRAALGHRYRAAGGGPPASETPVS
jgi:alkylation response protein AidB-like acyl-CoA dehydrogenase